MISRKVGREIQTSRTQELLGERGPKEKQAVRFGDLSTALGDALSVAKKTAITEAKKVVADNKPPFGIARYTAADAAITTSHIDGSPLVVMSNTVAGFGAGGFAVSFEGYLDNSGGLDGQFATVDMTVDGTRVGRVRAGVRSAAGTIRAMFPVSLSHAFNTAAVEPIIEIQAFTSNLDGDATGAMTFTLRQCRLVVSGTQ